MLASEAFAKCEAEGINSVSQRMAEAFFRIDDYVVGKAREQKLQRILNLFGDDPDLGKVVQQLAIKLKAQET